MAIKSLLRLGKVVKTCQSSLNKDTGRLRPRDMHDPTQVSLDRAPDPSDARQWLGLDLFDLKISNFDFKIDICYIANDQMSKEDLDVCFKLIEKTSSADYKASSMGWHPKEKRKEMQDRNMIYLLLRFAYNPNDELLGFLSFMYTNDDPPFADRQVVYIYEVHLTEELRGLGIGSHLISIAEMFAKKMDTKPKTMLTVFASNKGARRLYTKLGYGKDQCSPPDRKTRGRVIEADYIILSKENF